MMRPEELLGTVLRRAWIIVLCAAVAAFVAWSGTSSQAKTYTTSTRIMAIAEPPDYWMDLYAKNRLVSYRELINNYTFIAEALTQAGSSMDPGGAQSRLALGHSPDGNILHLVVTDEDPVRAAELVNALADAFILRNEADNEALLNQPRPDDAGAPLHVNMVKLDAPTPPTTPSGPRVKVNTLAGAIVGAVGGALIVFATIYLDDTLRRTEEIERYLRLPTLARLPERTRDG